MRFSCPTSNVPNKSRAQTGAFKAFVFNWNFTIKAQRVSPELLITTQVPFLTHLPPHLLLPTLSFTFLALPYSAQNTLKGVVLEKPCSGRFKVKHSNLKWERRQTKRYWRKEETHFTLVLTRINKNRSGSRGMERLDSPFPGTKTHPRLKQTIHQTHPNISIFAYSMQILL